MLGPVRRATLVLRVDRTTYLCKPPSADFLIQASQVH
jgi:hypothetical protein